MHLSEVEEQMEWCGGPLHRLVATGPKTSLQVNKLLQLNRPNGILRKIRKCGHTEESQIIFSLG